MANVSQLAQLTWEFVGQDHPLLFVILFVALVAIFFPNRFIWVRKLVAWLFSSVSGQARRYRQKRKILETLNPSINDIRRSMGDLGFTDLPKLEVKYQTRTSQPESIFEEGKITVFLSDAENQKSANVAKATMAYVNKGMYSSVRPYIAPTCSTALDLTLARAIVRKDKEALAYLSRVVINDTISSNEEVREYYQKLNIADRAGLLYDLLLHQLTLLSEQATPFVYEPHLLDEVKAFIAFVANLAERDRADVPLYFYRNHIKVGIFLLGRNETLEKGLNPYFVHLRRYVMGEYKGCYVLAAGRKIQIIERFKESIESNGYFQPRVNSEGAKIRVVNVTRQNGESSEAALMYLPLRRILPGTQE